MCASTVYGASCRTFICNDFNTGGTNTCVWVNTTASTEQKVRTCEANKNLTCSATKWGTVDQATANATCTNTTTDPVKNQTLPGDICKDKTECFGLDANVSCTGGVCATTAAVGTKCVATSDKPADAWCPVGTYCNGDTKAPVCVAQKGAGEACTGANQCTTGYGCVKNVTAASTTFNCTKFYSFTNGTQFDGQYLRNNAGYFLTSNDMCQTHHHVTITGTTYECRLPEHTGNGTNPATESDLVRTGGPTSDCTFTTYDTNAASGSTSQDNSLCGFNKDGSAYCNKRKGDSWFTKVLAAMMLTDFTGVKCHPSSGLKSCKAFVDTVTDKNIKLWDREMLALSNWASYAHNSKCVAESITVSYWQGDSPDSAFDSLTMSSFAAIVLTISALFYMF